MRRKLRVWWRHLWLDQADARRALGGSAGLEALTLAVQRCEARHAAQVRICIEASLPWRYLWRGDAPGVRARSMFAKLGVWDTEANNGVLIYALLADRALEIVADRGVHARVMAGQWDTALSQARQAIAAGGGLTQGLIAALEHIATTLEPLYPVPPGGDASDNELPDPPELG